MEARLVPTLSLEGALALAPPGLPIEKLKLDAQGQEAGVLRDALFPRRTDGQKAPPRLPVTASSEVPDNVRKAFTMFDFDHSGDIDSRELRKALEAMGMETDESQTRGVLAKYTPPYGPLCPLSYAHPMRTSCTPSHSL